MLLSKSTAERRTRPFYSFILSRFQDGSPQYQPSEYLQQPCAFSDAATRHQQRHQEQSADIAVRLAGYSLSTQSAFLLAKPFVCVPSVFSRRPATSRWSPVWLRFSTTATCISTCRNALALVHRTKLKRRTISCQVTGNDTAVLR